MLVFWDLSRLHDRASARKAEARWEVTRYNVEDEDDDDDEVGNAKKSTVGEPLDSVYQQPIY